MGLDLHNKQHAAVIMDCFNEKLGEITFQNNPKTVRRFMSKQEYKQFKKKGFIFNTNDSRGGMPDWKI